MASILGWEGWELGGPPRVMLACDDIAADIAACAAAEEPCAHFACGNSTQLLCRQFYHKYYTAIFEWTSFSSWQYWPRHSFLHAPNI